MHDMVMSKLLPPGGVAREFVDQPLAVSSKVRVPLL
jgi:hypothetical protein